ncbi:MAG: hypothetical protein EBZ77_00710 [Chitinophagia bacterium]|nr:hypothetical protein [Chitinophagia bacterium]
MMNFFESIKTKIAQYVEVYLDMLKVNVVEKSSYILSYFIFSLAGLFVFFCFIFLLSFGIVEAFVVLGISKIGALFLTAALYLLLLLLLFAMRKSLTRGVANMFISMFTDPDNTPKNP